MKLRSWLTTCSSSSSIATIADATVLLSLYHLFDGDTSPSSDSLDGATPSSLSSSLLSLSSRVTSSNSIIESNLSLQTLPFVPSLQTLTADSLNLSVSHHLLHALSPPCLLPVASLFLHDKLLYAACSHEIHIYDASNASASGEISHIDAFNVHASSSSSVNSVAFCGSWVGVAEGRHGLVATLPTVGDRLHRFMLPKNYVTVKGGKWVGGSGRHAAVVSALMVNDSVVYSVSWDKALKSWCGGGNSGSDLHCLESVQAHHDVVSAVVVAASRMAGEERHSLVATLEKNKSAVNALALTGDGSMLFFSACDRSILVWEQEDNANHMAVTGALRGHTKAILCLTNVVVLLLRRSADRTVRIWQRGLLASVSGSNGLVTVFSGSLDGEIRVWQVLVSSVDKGRSGSC
ncbi:hypothetical protein ACJRO7_031292 [Eucalyptus globulus]|uniref:Uncharacterized protein n=1 Tax=Eucalyptus globulus TaxID=34317 RepID=A0ABD3JS85_EUCGL